MQKPPLATPKNAIGERVRQARQRPSMQYSQAELSDCIRKTSLAVCRTMVSKIESGERSVTDYELIALAKCLDVSTAWLLGETTAYRSRRNPRQ